jgi:hypothetical protein
VPSVSDRIACAQSVNSWVHSINISFLEGNRIDVEVAPNRTDAPPLTEGIADQTCDSPRVTQAEGSETAPDSLRGLRPVRDTGKKIGQSLLRERQAR